MPAKTWLENPSGMSIVAAVAPKGASVSGVGTRMRKVCRSVVVALLLGAPTVAVAEGLNLSGSTKSRTALFATQSELIDKKLKKQYSGSVKLTPKGKKGHIRGQMLHDKLRHMRARGERCKVITLVRDPIATNVSGYFHKNEWWRES